MPQTLENGWVQSVWPLTIFSRAEGVSVLGVKSRRGNWRVVIDFSQALDLYVVCLRTVLSFTLNVTYWSTTRWHGHFGHTKKYSHSGLWHSSLPAWWDRHSAAYLINEKADTAQKCRPNIYSCPWVSADFVYIWRNNICNLWHFYSWAVNVTNHYDHLNQQKWCQHLRKKTKQQQQRVHACEYICEHVCDHSFSLLNNSAPPQRQHWH